MSAARQRSSHESRLDLFVGDWLNRNIVHPGRFGPGGESSGKATYRWAVMDKWLCYDSVLELPGMGPYQVQGGVAYDANIDRYRAFAVNNLGNLLVYTGDWQDETRLIFDALHPPPEKPARIIYTMLPDGSIKMESTTAEDSANYQPYFESTLTRAPG